MNPGALLAQVGPPECTRAQKRYLLPLPVVRSEAAGDSTQMRFHSECSRGLSQSLGASAAERTSLAWSTCKCRGRLAGSGAASRSGR